MTSIGFRRDNLFVIIEGESVGSSWVGSSIAEQKMTDNHETGHTVAIKIGYENRSLCDGFVEKEAYVQVQSSNVDEKVKSQATMAAPYRPFCAISHMTENLVGREDYVLSHNYKDECYLRDLFDQKAGKGTYESIFGAIGNPMITDPNTGMEVRLGAMNDADKIDVLKEIIRNSDNPEKMKILKQVDNILQRGEL